MTEPRRDLRDDLLAATAARRELTPDDERYLVENFLSKLDREIEARIDARIDARLASIPRRRGIEPWVVPAALGVAIPICAISAASAGAVGILLALGFVVAVLAIYAEYNGR
jgi:hypothetical protein